jgi:hypothetical protein
MSPNWARVLRGRKVAGSENPYSRPNIEQLRAKFKEAVPLLEFTSEAPSISREMEERVRALEQFRAGLTPEQLAIARKAGVLTRKTVTTPKQAEAMRAESKKDKGKDCENSAHCQRITDEENLAALLQEGWRVVATLPSGKIVVDR